jgi:hypothetical protein
MQGSVPTLGADDPVVVRRGDPMPPDELAERLTALGYERADVV